MVKNSCFYLTRIPAFLNPWLSSTFSLWCIHCVTPATFWLRMLRTHSFLLLSSNMPAMLRSRLLWLKKFIFPCSLIRDMFTCYNYMTNCRPLVYGADFIIAIPFYDYILQGAGEKDSMFTVPDLYYYYYYVLLLLRNIKIFPVAILNLYLRSSLAC